MNRTYLGEFEGLVLLTVAILNGVAYGLSIAEELRQRTDRSIDLSGAHVTLPDWKKKASSNRSGEGLRRLGAGLASDSFQSRLLQ